MDHQSNLFTHPPLHRPCPRQARPNLIRHLGGSCRNAGIGMGDPINLLGSTIPRRAFSCVSTVSNVGETEETQAAHSAGYISSQAEPAPPPSRPSGRQPTTPGGPAHPGPPEVVTRRALKHTHVPSENAETSEHISRLMGRQPWPNATTWSRTPPPPLSSSQKPPASNEYKIYSGEGA
ncbi:hypothetical protein CROQUDRAFT_108038 [Cronartium quercuum f. sp. fusiforme G11]|uniref:Uncharacterized protein n=1 Tax=Cronartium quercuum f. sp. fusiforme G11 TaxID=708437 RepID=A0A9P6NFK5_9BASI|nr:hypothetical protein CROQUDRAFT_108038 [Cronartium quercuum f. sp. fusiforme G11]